MGKKSSVVCRVELHTSPEHELAICPLPAAGALIAGTQEDISI